MNEQLRELKRLMSRVDVIDDHWIWTGGTNQQGYGRFRRTDDRLHGAHRAAYEIYRGPIQAGMLLDHVCFIRRCINPEHLRVVTQKQNMEHRAGAQANSSTGVRGVFWYPARGKYRARVGHRGHVINVGYFDSIEDADAAVQAKRAELFTHDDALALAS